MKVAARLAAPSAKARYQEIEKATGVPWFVVAIIHEREADQNWNAQLGQGDPLSAPSRHVPKGRGPFAAHDGHDAFYWGAVDALMKCAPYAGHWADWTAAGALTLLELYNGIGYEIYHHECSPYDWGATDQEERGKYTSDGRFSSVIWDTQIGCAAMIKGMIAIDPPIKFSDSVAEAMAS
jgi:lysozyme family protein